MTSVGDYMHTCKACRTVFSGHEHAMFCQKCIAESEACRPKPLDENTAEEAMTAAIDAVRDGDGETTADVARSIIGRLTAAGFAVVPVTELEMIADIGEGSTTANSLPHIARRIRLMLRAAARG